MYIVIVEFAFFYIQNMCKNWDLTVCMQYLRQQPDGRSSIANFTKKKTTMEISEI